MKRTIVKDVCFPVLLPQLSDTRGHLAMSFGRSYTTPAKNDQRLKKEQET